jgi:hypothetical protein
MSPTDFRPLSLRRLRTWIRTATVTVVTLAAGFGGGPTDFSPTR